MRDSGRSAYDPIADILRTSNRSKTGAFTCVLRLGRAVSKNALPLLFGHPIAIRLQDAWVTWRIVTDYLILFAVVLGVNLLPAFGPPTWTVIVIYGLSTKMPLPALVLVGAAAAALGRFTLAHGFRLLRKRIPEKMKRNLQAAGEAVEKRERGSLVAMGLFALSPLPSAQLFEAAGLTGLRLVHFTAAFFAGRIVSYSIYAATAKGIEKTSMGGAFKHYLTSPVGIAIEVLMLGLLVMLARVDWQKRLGGKGSQGQ